MDIKIPNEVAIILNKFAQSGYQIYIVGGAVRDLLMNRLVHDWDFTSDATPEEILKIFPEGFYDNKFGTIGVPLSVIAREVDTSTERSNLDFNEDSDVAIAPRNDNLIFEITTMRKEGDYKDFRHPIDVSWTNKIEEDLARRDFTINAVALTFTSLRANAKQSSQDKKIATSPPTATQLLAGPRNDNYKIIDPFNGQQDINDKLIRAVGDPNKRFQEDALRLIRAIRFAAQLNFQIEENTYDAIVKNSNLIKNVAFERIRDELFKLLSSQNPIEGVLLLKKTGILQIILPELERCFGLIQEGPKHDRVYDIGEHSLLSLKFCPSQDPLVRFAALIHDIGKPDTAGTQEDGNITFYNHDIVGGKIAFDIAKRFNLSKKQTDKLYKLVRWHLFTVDENQTDSAIRRFIKNVGVENIEDMMAVRIGDRLGGGTKRAISWRMEKFKSRITQVLQKPFSISDLKINGNDVMKELNIKPGPKVGEILQKLFEEVLEDSSKNNREYLLERIKKLS